MAVNCFDYCQFTIITKTINRMTKHLYTMDYSSYISAMCCCCGVVSY